MTLDDLRRLSERLTRQIERATAVELAGSSDEAAGTVLALVPLLVDVVEAAHQYLPVPLDRTKYEALLTALYALNDALDNGLFAGNVPGATGVST